MDTKLADLTLKPWLIDEPNQLGYEVVGDMQHLPTEEMLRIPGWVGTSIGKLRRPWGESRSLTLISEYGADKRTAFP